MLHIGQPENWLLTEDLGDIVIEHAFALHHEAPEQRHDDRGKHHRDEQQSHDDAASLEFAIEEHRHAKAEQQFDQHRWDDELPGDDKALPGLLIGQQIPVIGGANPDGRFIGVLNDRPLGEAEVERPEQRKNRDKQEQKHGRRQKRQRNPAIRQPAKTRANGERSRIAVPGWYLP